MVIFEFVEFLYVDVVEVVSIRVEEILLETLFIVLLVSVP